MHIARPASPVVCCCRYHARTGRRVRILGLDAFTRLVGREARVTLEEVDSAGCPKHALPASVRSTKLATARARVGWPPASFFEAERLGEAESDFAEMEFQDQLDAAERARIASERPDLLATFDALAGRPLSPARRGTLLKPDFCP